MRTFLSPTRRAVAANTVSQLVGKCISTGATIIISFLVAQKLGAAGYGDFAKITTYVAFFFLLADFGINAIYLKRKEKESFSTLVTTRVILGVALTFVAIAILAFLPQGTTQGFTPLVRFGIIFFAPAILFQALITTANAEFQKHLRYDLATIALFVGSLVSIALAILFFPPSSPYFFGHNNRDVPLIAAVSTLLFGIAITSLVAMALTRRFTKGQPFTVNISKVTPLFLASLPFGFTLLFNVVYTRADMMILTLLRSTQEVGVYALAYKVFELFLVIPTFFMNAVYPLMLTKTDSRLTIHDSRFNRILKMSTLFLACTSIIVVAIVWISAPLLPFINADFAASIPILRILSLSLPIFFLTSVTMWSLVAKGKQGSLLAIYSFSMLLNVASNALLIPQYGMLASAWITVAAEGVVLFLSALVLLQSLSESKNAQ